MSVFSVSLSADKNACVGTGTVLPYCHSYHFSETSLCSQYFATDFSGLRKSGYLFALNKEKKCGLLCFHFLGQQRNISQVPNSNGCHHKSLCMYRSGKWSPRGPLKKDSHPKSLCGSDCAHASRHVDSCGRSYVIHMHINIYIQIRSHFKIHLCMERVHDAWCLKCQSMSTSVAWLDWLIEGLWFIWSEPETPQCWDTKCQNSIQKEEQKKKTFTMFQSKCADYYFKQWTHTRGFMGPNV